MTNRTLTTGKRPRVHRTTLLIVVLFVIVPWVLVAIPGDSSKHGRANPSMWAGTNNQLHHGWPAVHLITVQLPVSWEQDEIKQPDSVFDWAFDHRNAKDLDGFHNSYWSDWNRWPITILHDNALQRLRKHSWRTVWLGVVINVMFVGVCCLFVGWLCERRIRKRGSIFRFTILEILLFVFFAGSVFAWINHCNQVAANEPENFVKIEKLKSKYNFTSVPIKHRDPLPRVLSRLFNFPDSLPTLRPGALRPLHSIAIFVQPLQPFMKSKDSLQQFAADINAIPIRKNLTVHWSKKVPELISALDPKTVSRLNLYIPKQTLPDLSFLKPVANRTTIIASAHVGSSATFNFETADTLAGIDDFHVGLTFPEQPRDALPDDWQVEHIKHLMGLKFVNRVAIHNMNETSARHLLKIGLNGKDVRFRDTDKFDPSSESAYKNNELVEQMLNAGMRIQPWPIVLSKDKFLD